MTSRRQFLTGASALLVAARGAEAQLRKGLPTVDLLYPGSSGARLTIRGIEAVEQGLREEGYVDGQDIAIRVKYGDSGSWLNLARDIVSLERLCDSRHGHAGDARRQASDQHRSNCRREYG